MENNNKTWLEVKNTGGLSSTITNIDDYNTQWYKNRKSVERFLDPLVGLQPYLKSDDIIHLHKLAFKDITDFGGQLSRTQLKFGDHLGAPPSTMKKELDLLDKQMDQLWCKAKNNEERVKALAFQHSRLVSIHGFPDGNGRISRLTTSFGFESTFDKAQGNKIDRGEYIKANGAALRADNVGQIASLWAKEFNVPYTGHKHELSEYRTASFQVEYDLEKDGMELSKQNRGESKTDHLWMKSYDVLKMVEDSNGKTTKFYDDAEDKLSTQLKKPMSIANTVQAVKDFKQSGAVKKKLFGEYKPSAFDALVVSRMSRAVEFSAPVKQEQFNELVKGFMNDEVSKNDLKEFLKGEGWKKEPLVHRELKERKSLSQRSKEILNECSINKSRGIRQ